MFIREYLRMLAIVAAAMTVYYFTINPWIEWKSGQVKIITQNFVSNERQDVWWNSLFEQGAWQRDTPKMLRTRNAILLFKDFESVGPDRYRLSPLTVLAPQGSPLETDSTAPPTSVVYVDCPAGAEMQFGGPMDWTVGKTPPLIGGQLSGEVHITSHRLEAGKIAETNFSAESSNVVINGHRIWSVQKVAVRLGQSIIEGQDFWISLSTNLLGPDKEETPGSGPFAGLDRMELIYVNKVEFALPPGGLLRKKTSLTDDTDPIANASAKLKINCKKSFTFDFQRKLATLNDNIVMQHVVEGLPPDQFTANQVDLQFEHTPESPLASTQSIIQDDPTANKIAMPQAKMEMSDGTLQLIRFEAYGASNNDITDRSRWLNVDAPNFQTKCKARWMQFLIREQEIGFANRLPTETSIETSPVYLQRDQLQVWAPRLEFKFTPVSSDSTAAKSDHLGLLWAEGPGEAAMIAGNGDAWNINWANLLTLQPSGDEDKLVVDGSAQVRSERQGKFSADKISLWLQQVEKPAASVQQLVTLGPPNSSNDSSLELLPMRLHAVKDVIVNSPSLRAQVAALTIWFKHLPAAAALTDAPHKLASTDRQPAVQNPIGKNNAMLSPPIAAPTSMKQDDVEDLLGANQRRASASLVSQPTTIRDPLTVTGSTLEARLLCRPETDPVLDDLILDGDVTMTKDRLSDDVALPVTITASMVNIQGGGDQDAIIHIIGTPAHVMLGSGNVIGESIHFDQRSQLLFMDRPGEMTLPPELINKAKPESAKSARLVRSDLQPPPLMNRSRTNNDDTKGYFVQPPRIIWDGQLTFDGYLMQMKQGVTIQAKWQSDANTLWHIETHSEQLQVELTASVFAPSPAKQSSLSMDSERAQIRSLQLLGNVDVKAAQTDLKVERKSLEHMEMPTLAIFPQTQKILGSGPGSLRSRRFTRSNDSQNENVSANGSNLFSNNASNKDDSRLQCIHLSYFGQMDGSYADNRVTFRQNVATAMGTIAQWSDSIDVDRINVPTAGQTKLESEELSIYSTSQLPHIQQMEQRFPGSTKSAWELVATRNVVVNSATEQGLISLSANEGRYDALNEVLKISGQPGKPATVQKQPSGTDVQGMNAAIADGLFNLRTGAWNFQPLYIRGSIPEAQSQSPAAASSLPSPR